MPQPVGIRESGAAASQEPFDAARLIADPTQLATSALGFGSTTVKLEQADPLLDPPCSLDEGRPPRRQVAQAIGYMKQLKQD